MKVLLVGMKKAENQFTRGLDQYAGLTYVHCDSSHRGDFPPCDVAILATCQMGQSQLNYAKQHFKATGTPYIIAGQSFSRIKDDFDQVLERQGYRQKTASESIQSPVSLPADIKVQRRTTTIGLAFKQAAPETPTPPRPRTPERKFDLDLPKFMAPSEESYKASRDWLFKKDPAVGAMLGVFKYAGLNEKKSAVVIECKDQDRNMFDKISKDEAIQKKILYAFQRHMGFSIKGIRMKMDSPVEISGYELGELFETYSTQNNYGVYDMIKHLNDNNFVKPSGKPWTASDVYNARTRYRIKTAEDKAIREAEEFEAKRKAMLPKTDELPKTQLPPVVSAPASLPPIPESLKPKPPPEPKVPSTPEELRVRDELISKVLALKDMDPLKKLELIEEINAGVRTVEHQIIAERKGPNLQLTAQSIFFAGDKAVLTMDKSLAKDIVSAIEDIKAFAEGVEK